ncbi:MAG: enoyl-CoA hydratase [Acidimicrobiales bacterium]
MTDNLPPLLSTTDGGVATLTLNRPAARNALDRSLRAALWQAVADAGDDPEVDAVVLTGADPAFCAGVDLRELAGGAAPESPAGAGRRDRNGLFRYFPLIDKPIIGAVNGPAVTGGLEVALQCTFLVASERARFADTHARVGVMPGGGMTVFLAEAVGFRRALELSLTGNFLTAEQAYALGLVNHVVPHEQLLATARALAADIAGNDRRGVRRLLGHYRELANAATADDAHLLEGEMAESWLAAAGGEPPLSDDQRRAVEARGRAQSTGGADRR